LLGEVFSHAAAYFRFRSVIHDRTWVDLDELKSEATDVERYELLNVAKDGSNNEVSSEATSDLGRTSSSRSTLLKEK
jgi:hypothetical protein